MSRRRLVVTTVPDPDAALPDQLHWRSDMSLLD
jgi:hypothetical protein